VNYENYCDVLLLNLKQLLSEICQAVDDFCFQRTARAQGHWAAATQDSELHTRRSLPEDQTSVL